MSHKESSVPTEAELVASLSEQVRELYMRLALIGATDQLTRLAEEAAGERDSSILFRRLAERQRAGDSEQAGRVAPVGRFSSKSGDELHARLQQVSRGRPTMSIPETMEVTGWSRGTTYRAVNAGALPTVKGNGRKRIVSVVALEKYLRGER